MFLIMAKAIRSKKGDSFTVKVNGKIKKFPVQELPKDFVEWNLGQRIANLQKMRVKLEGKDHSAIVGGGFGSHLPVYITQSAEKGALFPVNAAVKGTGFVAKDEYLDYYIKKFRTVYEATEIRDQATQKEITRSVVTRVETIMEFYEATDKIDFRCMAGLEIWPGRTTKNFHADPRVSIHYLGLSMPKRPGRYGQWQVNCIWEKLERRDKRFEFGDALRALTLGSVGRSFVPGHVPTAHTPTKGQYPFGWALWVIETLDKGIDNPRD